MHLRRQGHYGRRLQSGLVLEPTPFRRHFRQDRNAGAADLFLQSLHVASDLIKHEIDSFLLLDNMFLPIVACAPDHLGIGGGTKIRKKCTAKLFFVFMQSEVRHCVSPVNWFGQVRRRIDCPACPVSARFVQEP